jgi:hypothetical protein
MIHRRPLLQLRKVLPPERGAERVDVRPNSNHRPRLLQC